MPWTDSWEWIRVDTSACKPLDASQGATQPGPAGAGGSKQAGNSMLARVGHTAVVATLPGQGRGLVICAGQDADENLRSDAVFLPLRV